MHICVFEDQYYSNLLPLVYLRPVYELRSGINNLLLNITGQIKKLPLILTVRSYLKDIVSTYKSDILINSFPDDDILFLNGRLLRIDGLKSIIKNLNSDCILYINDDIAGFYCKRKSLNDVKRCITDGIVNSSLLKNYKEKKCSGKMIRYSWDLIHNSYDEIEIQFREISKKISRSVKKYKGAYIINSKNVAISSNAEIKPGVVLDAEKGPIVIGQNVIIMPNAVIQGPVYIGRNSIIKAGAVIYPGTSIGEYSKIGGEIECSIVQSYSNKQHSGYLGHSYLGSWVNIGADTNTSDLKNNYSNVRVYVNGSMIDSGKQFVGLTMGDHSKSGINVMFDTGSVVGISCNIYGAGLPPKFIPSFSWGSGSTYTEYDVNKSIETMKKVMARRQVEMRPEYVQIIKHIFTETIHERQKAGVV